MSVTVILTSHMKPFLRDALVSLDAQTRRDFRVVLADSGLWRGQSDELSAEMAAVYDDYRDHPQITWVFTGESPGSLSCPVSCATNAVIRAGLVTGAYVCHFYDDDEYYPTFIERMAGYLDENADRLAVWCSQDRVRIERSGQRIEAGRIDAYDGLHAGEIDCRVDGGQVMYRREVLDGLGDPWMSEEGASCSHSDGLFLERVALLAGPYGAVTDTLLAHRFTPLSTYSPT